MDVYKVIKAAFLLGYENGTNNNNRLEENHSWELNKYFFEKPIEKIESQAKEIEGLREWKEDASEMLDNIKYWDTVPDDYLERIDKLLPQDTTQPDKGGE